MAEQKKNKRVENKKTTKKTIKKSSEEKTTKKQTNKSINNKSTNEDKSPINIGNIIYWFFISLILLSAIYIFLSIIFYFFYGTADEPFLVNGFSAVNNESFNTANPLGRLGACLGYLLVKQGFGIAAILIPVWLFLLFYSIIKKNVSIFLKYQVYTLVPLILLPLFLTLFGDVAGGLWGATIKNLLTPYIGKTFFAILVIIINVVFFFWLFKVSYKELFSKFKSLVKNKSQKTQLSRDENLNKEILLDKVDTNIEENKQNIIIDEPQPHYAWDIENDKEIINKENNTPINDEVLQDNKAKNDIEFTIETIEDTKNEIETPNAEPTKQQEFVPEIYNLDYQLPPYDILKYYEIPNNRVTKEELEANKNKIVETLAQYQIQISKINATVGPTVTLYEIVPAPGVRISKIRNLEDDIALSLAAYGIRIIAPIPGKGTIGIEVPNSNKETVSIRTVLESEKFKNFQGELPIVIGKTISNDVYVADLTKMPHLLIAGATGQGKSVGINTIIASLLYKKLPHEIKFIFIDPKKVELSPYAKLENHYLAKIPNETEPIVTDVDKVVKTLYSLTMLMDTRYDFLKQAGVKNIVEYNKKYLAGMLDPEEGHEFMPYIVLVIDEFADLIMTAGKEVELPVARIAQLARAVGIHVIIATQRPSVDVITGKIKANFPARIAFRVSSKVDSRTILDVNGAEQLIGRGDMLFAVGSELIRIQCAFIDTPEIDALMEYISQQPGFPEAYILPEPIMEGTNPQIIEIQALDPLIMDAAAIIISAQQGSISLLQRKLQIGHNRAGRLMDQLEALNIVGPQIGSKPRDVLISDISQLEQILNSPN
ncbi:MAG TPA: DNA translocase FtsK 4TM domain-containing protein [Bacteroidales bacterium]|nr:DNA translocase FtsK 4TM domain-containing protein [Bacteroidales bacterium]HPZ36172.1 DNA translocase FtsK 4TM domain-containing protein [Bacteroidales bacterium]HQD34686.1 DNA translocase FtsK 4TM domain-containing protein [Bacteroidales bacterium]